MRNKYFAVGRSVQQEPQLMKLVPGQGGVVEADYAHGQLPSTGHLLIQYEVPGMTSSHLPGHLLIQCAVSGISSCWF